MSIFYTKNIFKNVNKNPFGNFKIFLIFEVKDNADNFDNKKQNLLRFNSLKILIDCSLKSWNLQNL